MRRSLFMGLLVFVLGSLIRAEEPPESTLPLPAPGWTISLPICSPEILNPSAIVASADGVIYIGQKPPGRRGSKASILALKGCKVQAFADDLGSVRGLEWVDGTIFAVHDTMLSALLDTDGDGRSDRRTPLVTGLGPESPPPSGPDDFSAGGLRLGMDGRLYIAVSDRGIFRAVGKDGRTVQLHGGGVICVRPDGTGLEVISTGDRDPRSVALDISGELFTFGSGNNSRRWPGGLTHHIDGGRYGYPYQFLVAPFRTLPVMGGEVGGAGAQAVCYLDDGLPARYKGSFFACDESRQTVVRWEVRKSGGTFAIAGRTELVTKGDADVFQPVALAPISGGSGFWILGRGDPADGPGRTVGGRIYQLAYDGTDRVQPGPRPRLDDLATRIAALDHPANSVRLEAQRSLARQGGVAVPLLIRRLQSAQPEAGRLNALWALDAQDHDQARQAIRDALGDRSPRVRFQAARSCGLRGDREAVGGLAALLADPDPALRREAAIALGRTGSPQALGPLVAALGEPDRFAAWSVRVALQRLGYPARDAMRDVLLDPRRRESALILADEAWCVPVIEALVEALKLTKEPAVRVRFVAALAGQYRKYPEWTGAWWGPDPLTGPFPRKTQDWDVAGMSGVLQGLRQGLADGDSSVRFQAIVALGEVGTPAAPILRAGFAAESDPRNLESLVEALGAAGDVESIRLITSLLIDPGRPEPVRAAALDALARYRSPDVLRARVGLLYDPKAPQSLVARVLPSLTRDGMLPANDLAGFLESPSPLVRASALMSLNVKKALPKELKELVLARLDDSSVDVRQAAIAAAGALTLREAIPHLIQAAGKPEAELRTQAISALCRMPDPRAATIYREAAADTDPSLRRAGVQALKAIGGTVDPNLARAGSSRPANTTVAALSRFALGHPGDPRSGEELFFENKSLACVRCHAANGRGTAHQGPDLSGLGARCDEARIIAALLEPSLPLAAAHQPVADQIRSLTSLQFTDLVCFLRELKTTPAGAPPSPPVSR